MFCYNCWEILFKFFFFFQHQLWLTLWLDDTIDPLCKSHNAPVPYPTMQHFVTEMCTHVNIFVTKCGIVGNGALWDICLMHCGIYVRGVYDTRTDPVHWSMHKTACITGVGGVNSSLLTTQAFPHHARCSTSLSIQTIIFIPHWTDEYITWPVRSNPLTHWGWVTHASVQHTSIASDNGLSPVRGQATISTNAAIFQSIFV